MITHLNNRKNLKENIVNNAIDKVLNSLNDQDIKIDKKQIIPYYHNNDDDRSKQSIEKVKKFILK